MPAPKGHPPYNTTNEGRPKKYTDEFIENEAIEFEKWMDDPKNKCIFIKEFSLKRGYHSTRLAEFAAVNESFALALAKSKEWQETKLATGALTRKYDAGFTKFTMAMTCGWVETKNIKLTSEGPVPDWIKQTEGKSKGLLSD